MSGKISFWTEVKCGFPLSDYAEGYFSFLSPNGKFVAPRPGIAIEVYDSPPSGLTIPKVMAYAISVIPFLAYGLNRLSFKKAIAFSLVVPVGAFVVKALFHATLNRAVVVQRPTKEQWIGFNELTSKIDYSRLEQRSMEFNIKYRLASEQVVELQIQRKDHKLPQGNNMIYAIPAISYQHVSPLYPDSYFEIEYKGRYNSRTDRIEDMYYEVVRTPIDAPLLDLHQKHRLGLTEVVDLALIPVDNSNMAISLRPEYVGSIFSYQKESNGLYTITRTETSGYPRMFFNNGIQLDEARIKELQLNFIGVSKDLVKGETWTYHTSNILEYKNSVFMIKEDKGTCTVVRMLEPKKD